MRKRGFSLLETVMATTLLAGVMLLLFNLYPSAALAVRRSQDRLHADALAQSLIAEVRSGPYSSLQIGTSTRPAVTVGTTVFVPKVEIFQVPGSDPKVLLGVRVDVHWDWVRGKQSVSHELYRVNLER